VDLIKQNQRALFSFSSLALWQKLIGSQRIKIHLLSQTRSHACSMLQHKMPVQAGWVGGCKAASACVYRNLWLLGAELCINWCREFERVITRQSLVFFMGPIPLNCKQIMNSNENAGLIFYIIYAPVLRNCAVIVIKILRRKC